MSPEPRFFILLAAIVCALIAALREYRGAGHAGLFPLAFALSILPAVWDTAETAF